MTLKSEHLPQEQRKNLSVWCEDCGHQAEPDPAELARRYGADTPIPEWHRRLVCSGCGGREVDFVLTGARGVTTRPCRIEDERASCPPREARLKGANHPGLTCLAGRDFMIVARYGDEATSCRWGDATPRRSGPRLDSRPRFRSLLRDTAAGQQLAR